MACKKLSSFATANSASRDSQIAILAGFETIDPLLIVDTPGLAEILRLKPRTIEIWARYRKIPVFKLSARCRRFRVADVIRALQKFEVKEAGYAAGQTK